MNVFVISSLVSGLALAGCATQPPAHGMKSHEDCMARMHPTGDGGEHRMSPEEHQKMMRDCPMMQGGHDQHDTKAATPDHAGEAAHQH